MGLSTLAILGLVVLVWLDQLLRQTGRPELVVLNPTAFAPVLGAMTTATVGAVVAAAAQRPLGASSQVGSGPTSSQCSCGCWHDVT